MYDSICKSTQLTLQHSMNVSCRAFFWAWNMTWGAICHGRLTVHLPWRNNTWAPLCKQRLACCIRNVITMVCRHTGRLASTMECLLGEVTSLYLNCLKTWHFWQSRVQVPWHQHAIFPFSTTLTSCLLVTWVWQSPSNNFLISLWKC